MYKLFLDVKVKKNQEGKPYLVTYLICDCDYRKILISYDKQIIAELLGLSMAQLLTLPEGVYECGSVHSINKK